MLDQLDRHGGEQEDSHVVSWQPHGRCFVIHDPQAFKQVLLPRYFPKLSKVTSFQRQLNLYGFQRITQGLDKGSYYHECFLRGKPYLAYEIQRIKVKGTGVRGKSNPDQEPNFWAMEWVGTSHNPTSAMSTSPEWNHPQQQGVKTRRNKKPSSHKKNILNATSKTTKRTSITPSASMDEEEEASIVPEQAASLVTSPSSSSSNNNNNDCVSVVSSSEDEAEADNNNAMDAEDDNESCLQQLGCATTSQTSTSKGGLPYSAASSENLVLPTSMDIDTTATALEQAEEETNHSSTAVSCNAAAVAALSSSSSFPWLFAPTDVILTEWGMPFHALHALPEDIVSHAQHHHSTNTTYNKNNNSIQTTKTPPPSPDQDAVDHYCDALPNLVNSTSQNFVGDLEDQWYMEQVLCRMVHDRELQQQQHDDNDGEEDQGPAFLSHHNDDEEDHDDHELVGLLDSITAV